MAPRCKDDIEIEYEEDRPTADPFVPMVSPYGVFENAVMAFSEDLNSADTATLVDKVTNYISMLTVAQKPPTLSGLARVLGMNSSKLKQAIREYNNDPGFTSTAYGRVMTWSLSQIEEFVETGMLDGTINAAAAKFALTRMGWDQAPSTTNMTLNLTVSQVDSKIRAILGVGADAVLRAVSGEVDTEYETLEG